MNKSIRTVLNCRSSALDSKPFTGELKRASGRRLCPGEHLFFFGFFKDRNEKFSVCTDPGFLKLNVFHLTFSCKPIVLPKPRNHDRLLQTPRGNPADRRSVVFKRPQLSQAVYGRLAAAAAPLAPSALDCALLQ